MRVEIRSHGKGTVGEVTLVAGRAVASEGAASRLLDGFHVVEPGTLAPLGPESGERYLRALPANLSGTYVWATLVEEDAHG